MRRDSKGQVLSEAESPEPVEEEVGGDEETDPDDLSIAPIASRVMAPTDFSSDADRALGLAIRYAKLLGASMEIVHVQPPVVYQAPEVPRRGLGSMAEEPDVEQDLARRAGKARRAGLQCQTVCLSGTPAEQIVARAAETGADLIVIGSHGRTGFRKALLGSVAEQVVHKAGCPVLMVPALDRRK
jgi:universal stress protein A